MNSKLEQEISRLDCSIGRLSEMVNALREDLNKEIWIRENPPKYKYGDSVYVHIDNTSYKSKILECEVQELYRFAQPTGFVWKYRLDVSGVGLREFAEDDINV